MVGVQQQQEGIIHDDIPARVFFLNRVAGQDKSNGSHMSLSPVRLVHFLAVCMEPYDILDLAAMNLSSLKKPASAEHGMGLSERNELPDERMQRPVSFGLMPIVPADFIILAVGIVITRLGTADFVPSA